MFIVIPRGVQFNQVTRLPLISYAVVLVCIIIFYFQYQNQIEFEEDRISFCKSINSNESAAMDKMAADNYLCQLMIKRLEQRPYLSTQKIIHQYFWFNDHNEQQIDEMAGYIEKHYEHYAKKHTRYLNRELVYYPEMLDPVRMITSIFAHGDIWHIIGNLIFFLAFAPALELVLAKAWQFVVVCLVVIFTTSMAYSASVLIGQDALPALGLSGVVMGMIGLFAAVMPDKKIWVFVWILIYFKNINIPAWILAAWYIGWDALDLILGTGDPAINLVAHVIGGITGYALGYFWLKDQVTLFNQQDSIAHHLQ